AGLRECRNDRSSTNDQPIQAGEDSGVRPKATCYRIQGIPITVTEENLQRQLAPTVGGQESSNLHLTLARSFGEYQTATFMSTSIPRNLEYPVDAEFIGITPLFEPKDAKIDIIAVHGLGSHAVGGFKSKGTNHVWLRDSLPHDIPNSRILLYGYDSSVMNKDHRISISGLGKTFLSSYKTFRKDTKALCLASDGERDSQNRDFCRSSHGLVFFGVPNLGLKHESLKEITREHLNRQLILDLSVDTESEPTSYLQGLQERFVSCHRKQKPPMKIVSFYEEKKTPTVAVDNTGKLGRAGESCFMVTRESACRIGFEDDTHSQQPLPFDHSDLVKFMRREDPSYRIVQGKLGDLVQEGCDSVPRRFQSDIELSEEQKRHWDDLNVPDYRAFYKNEEKLAKPVEGSLQWLVSKDSQRPQGEDSLQYEDFETWRDGPTSSSLLVLGPPGLGKSVLSNFVVNHIQQSVKDRCNDKVIFFFCNIKDDNARTASSVLRALIVQLCTDKRYFQKLPNRFQTKGESKTFHSAAFDELWRTFDDMVQSGLHRRIFCIIDGLDVYETAGMEHLVTKLGEMAGRCPIRLLFTSRPDGPVGSFPPETRRNLRQPNHDVQVFITKQLELLPRSFSRFHTDIREGILGRAGGTFLWIHIILKEIRRIDFPNRKSVQKVIEKTPRELDELYTDLFRAASRGKHAIAILAWVAYAKRPLSLRELETAVAVMLTNSGNWADCLEDRISLDADLIKERLGTLIDVIDGELFVIHQSLLDFLKSRPTIWHEGDLELQLPRPNLALGRACMRYLSFGDVTIRKDEISVEEDCSGKEGATFLRYAATYWHEHIESIDDVKDSIDLVQSILMGSNHEHWTRWNERKVWYRTSSIFDICVYFDIGWLASGLSDPSVPELSHQFTEESLVQIAMYAPKVLSHILQNDIMPGFQITPRVVTAAAVSPYETLKLLLEHRGDEIPTTPEIVTAAVRSKMEVLEFLLEKRGNEFQITPEVVELAAGSPYGTLKLLLEKRGDEIPITPELVTAVAGNTVEALEFLLEKRGNEFQITPEAVELAAGRSSKNLKLLLEKRGDEFQITPEAVAAAARRSPKTLKLLLEKRGDEIQITPEVVIAAVNGYRVKETIEILLDKKGNEIQSTPEVFIAAAGHQNGMKLLEFLLEKRGDEIQITPEVLIAAAWRSPENLKLLLERGGDEIHITPEVVIAAALAAWGSSENLKLLLEKKGDKILITPKVVKVAAAWGSSENLKLLLDKGGDEIKITPEVVVAAAVAAWGSSEKLKVLREKRGDGNRLTHELFMAATEAYGSSEDLKLLLEKRVDDFPFTPEVDTIAALRSSGNLKLLLEERGDEIRTMLISSNFCHGEKIQEMERDELLELCRIVVEKAVSAEK
ncbi:unnamed protein product, partial [Clonostachys byssicola]